MHVALFGMAVLLSVVAVFVLSVEVWAWIADHKTPHLVALLLPTIALSNWRSVHLEWPGSVTLARLLGVGRIALLMWMGLMAVIGGYDWSWRGGSVIVPLFAALYLTIEALRRTDGRLPWETAV